jgi:CHAT domain
MSRAYFGQELARFVQDGALLVLPRIKCLNLSGHSAALREAQKAMIANPATQHLYYWAAFVPIGSWTPLAAKWVR